MTIISFAGLLWQNTARALILLAATECVLLTVRRRRASAAQRYITMMLGLTTLIALPILPFVLPAKVVPATHVATFHAPAQAAPPQLIAALGEVMNSSDDAGATPQRSTPLGSSRADHSARWTVSPATTTLPNWAIAPPRQIAFTLAFLYLIGATLSALRFSAAYIRLHLTARRRYRSIADSAWAQRVIRLAGTQGGVRSIQVRQAIDSSDAPFATPVTYGLIHPTLLLPSDATMEGWTPACTEAVLRHEIAHVQRADWAGQTIANAACALYWFIPLVWSQARRLKANAEVACDDRVLQAGVPAPDYADHLLHIARSLRSATTALRGRQLLGRSDQIVLGMAQRQASVEERLVSVLTPRLNRSSVPARTVALMAVIALLVVAPAAALRRTAESRAVPAFPRSDAAAAIALLQRVQAATLRLNSVTEDFTYWQRTVATTGEWADRLGRNGQTISGRVEMMRPNYARVRFTHMPKAAFPNLVDSDGKTVYTFTPTSFRPPRQFAKGPFDPAVGAQQASGLRAGGGTYSAEPAQAGGENVHLWDAAPIQAFFDPTNAVKTWLYVENLHDLRYDGFIVLHGVQYQVLEHYLPGTTTAGHGRPYDQYLYIGADNLIHGYLLKYVCEGESAFQVAWLKNIRGNTALQPSDFAFQPPTGGK